MLALSLARPETTVQVAVQRASVVLVTDVSRSMSATDVSPTRLEAARQAASSFLDKVPDELRVGLVTFSDVAQTLQTPTTDHDAVDDQLDTMQPISGTATGAGLRTALDDLKVGSDDSARRPPAALVLLSDGSATDGAAADIVASEAKRLRVPIYTVALGTPDGTITLRGQTLNVPPDIDALKRIAVRVRAARRSAPRTPTSSARSTRSSARRSARSPSSARSPPGSPAARCCCSAARWPARCGWAAACPDRSGCGAATSTPPRDAAQRPPDSSRASTWHGLLGGPRDRVEHEVGVKRRLVPRRAGRSPRAERLAPRRDGRSARPCGRAAGSSTVAGRIVDGAEQLTLGKLREQPLDVGGRDLPGHVIGVHERADELLP